MPEFLGRPNLPNGLANTLVQLASQQSDPMAAALNQVGKLADTYSEMEDRKRMLREHADIVEQGKQRDFAREKELKGMELDHKVFEKLLGDDRIMGALANPRGPSAADASRLVGSGVKTSADMVRDDFGAPPATAATPPKGSVKASSLGIKISGDPYILPKKDKVSIDQSVAAGLHLPASMIGKELPTELVAQLAVRNNRIDKLYGGHGDKDPLMAQAVQIAKGMVNLVDADDATITGTISSIYDNLKKIKSGEGVERPPPKEKPKPEGFNFFGMFGKKTQVTSGAAPKSLPGLE